MGRWTDKRRRHGSPRVPVTVTGTDVDSTVGAGFPRRSAEKTLPIRVIDEKARLGRTGCSSSQLLGDRVVGTVMAGYDGHRGWVYRLAVSPGHRGEGIAARLMRQAEAALAARGCAKVNLQVRAGNEAVVGFYRSLGYEVEERISLGKELARSARRDED